jgi:hypothetical protein
METWILSPVVTFTIVGTAALLAFLIPRHWLSERKRLHLSHDVPLPAVPLTVALQTQLVQELTHFHTPWLDALLQKLGPPMTLTEDEADALCVAILEQLQEISDCLSADERDAASILPVVIKRALRESATLGTEPVTVQLVLIPQRRHESYPVKS